jgi:hypothetical protein
MIKRFCSFILQSKYLNKGVSLKLLLIIFSLISFKTLANDAVTTMTDYTQHAMTELAASPPLRLLRNTKGESRHEFVFGYIDTTVDDDAILSTGDTADEKGNAKGVGFGYGYSHSYKEKWAIFFWLQAVQQSGDHEQKIDGVVRARITDMETVNLSLAFGVSYEFLRDSENHTLNLFMGPSLLMLQTSGAIETFDASSSYTSAFDGTFEGVLPAITLGLMYEYKVMNKLQIIPYFIVSYSLADECQSYTVDNVSLNDSGANANSPECDGVVNGTVDGETDVAPSIITVGVKFHYEPWNMGFNISGVIRDAFMRTEDEDRAQVKGALLSLNKTW